VTADEIRACFNDLTVWKRGDRRAPHKPLLLLFALARLQRGEAGLIPYETVDEVLGRLLREFGPASERIHTEYPFWRLQNDGIWELNRTEGLERRASNNDAKKSELLRHDVAGGFPPDLERTLRDVPALIGELAALLLEAHFPETLHQDIADAVGLDLGMQVVRRRKRDREFRVRVLRAYGYRCAVCRWDVQLDTVPIGLEAAHVRWHQASGPDHETNGLALCTMHHKLLDYGAFRISEDYRLFVSDRVHGTAGLEEWLLRFSGEPILRPRETAYDLRPEHLHWHVREVFKGERQ
jgi:putative restriction endonuclease